MCRIVLRVSIVTMSMERAKRAPSRSKCHHNVRSKCDLGSPSLVVITNYGIDVGRYLLVIEKDTIDARYV